MRYFSVALLTLMVLFLPGRPPWASTHNPLPVPQTITIPAGYWLAGSSPQEREMAYRLDEDAYGHSRTRERKWYENERTLQTRFLKVYAISRTPVTNRQYSAFITATRHRLPDVKRDVWDGYGLIHPYERTRRHAWVDGSYPEGRADHPVVLVSIDDAMAYARWLSEQTGQTWRVPSEEEFEKAARGTDGRYFPWGNVYKPGLLNTHDDGPFDTLPVASFLLGRSPFGLLDGAGQVFEWTRSSYSTGRYVVKGGSWDDKGCGICRAAARHTRPGGLKHILIGFRVVRVME